MELTLVEMLERNARERPGKPALIYKGLRLSHEELNRTVNRAAHSLAGMGIAQGDRVGLMLPRVPELVIGFLASVKIGAVPAPVNFNSTPEGVRAFLNSLEPSVVLADRKFLGLLDGAEWKGKIVAANGKDGDHGRIPWERLLEGSAENPRREVRPGDAAYLNYTTGSTGEPKGAVATHANLYWNTRASVEAFGITDRDAHLCMFSAFAHPHELFARALYAGGSLVLLDEIFPKSLAKTIREEGITCAMGLAPMYQLLLDVADREDLKTLRLPESGGMHTHPGLIERFESAFGVPIFPVWGSTETTGIAIANRPGQDRRDGSLGTPCPHYEVRAVDERGQDVAPGEAGELIFRGPGVVREYFIGQGRLADCLRDGWYYSGDLGRRDEEGYFYFADRKSAMMKVAGLKVYPLEIEEVLKLHPKIREAAVIAVSDGLKGEVPMAILSLREGQTLAKEEVAAFCKKSLPNYKIPKRVEFWDDLPRIGSGKIDKKAIKRILS